jgi:hypothetical protein
VSREELIRLSTDVAEEYGGNLTVRQLYYQLVARGHAPSGQAVYKRVVDAVSKARMTGEMPFDWIVDRTRECRASEAFTSNISVKDALGQAKGWINSMPEWALARARWYGQPCYVTVGVEKEALAGVMEGPCRELGVGLFVFRGYSSLSALYQLAGHLERADTGGAEEAVLLYFGDFDPDGWEIPRSAMRNVEEIADVTGLALPPVTMRRVALNRDQIDRYNPPPFEAKVTSSRYAGYRTEHRTDKAWELDALRPDVLQRLIRDSVAEHFDEAIYADNRELVDQRRAEMRAEMRSPGWIDKVLSP